MEVSADWILGGTMDFEYKKYRLLAYFQRVEQALMQLRLFPQLPELRLHYSSLRAVRSSKEGLRKQFPRTLEGIQRDWLGLKYAPMQQQQKALDAIDAIIDFSLPRFAHYVTEAEGIFKTVEKGVTVAPIGMVPLYVDEGYLLFHQSTEKRTHVYEYASRIVGSTEPTKAMRTKFVTAFPSRLGATMGAVKAQLIKTRPKLPNPATYVVESELNVPVEQTLLPVATKLLSLIHSSKG